MEDRITVGARATIAADTQITGAVTIGSETVVHPKASILAIGGPISIGSRCVVEEGAIIVNRRSTTLEIGDENYFEVGSRVEAASVGSHNTFEVRCYVGPDVRVQSFCTVGAGCTLVASSAPQPDAEQLLAQELGEEGQAVVHPAGQADAAATERIETLPDRTVIFGQDSKRRLWSGEGVKQQTALHAKHLDYLRDAIPKANKLKVV